MLYLKWIGGTKNLIRNTKYKTRNHQHIETHLVTPLPELEAVTIHSTQKLILLGIPLQERGQELLLTKLISKILLINQIQRRVQYLKTQNQLIQFKRAVTDMEVKSNKKL